MGKAPIDRLIDQTVVFRCLVCGAKMGECDCWTACSCGWSYRKGTACRNPICQPSKTTKRKTKGGRA